jgi:hypothetical protein
LGELDATVDGEPEPVPEVWRRSRNEIEQKLKLLMSSDEVTEGDPILSRKAHAQAAIECLQDADWSTAAMADEIDPEDSKSEDRKWLIEVAAGLVCVGFYAGMHARAALGKEIEMHAVRGEKTLKAASEGGRQRRGKLKPATLLILNTMDELIEKGIRRQTPRNWRTNKSALGPRLEQTKNFIAVTSSVSWDIPGQMS